MVNAVYHRPLSPKRGKGSAYVLVQRVHVQKMAPFDLNVVRDLRDPAAPFVDEDGVSVLIIDLDPFVHQVQGSSQEVLAVDILLHEDRRRNLGANSIISEPVIFPDHGTFDAVRIKTRENIGYRLANASSPDNVKEFSQVLIVPLDAGNYVLISQFYDYVYYSHRTLLSSKHKKIILMIIYHKKP